MADFCCDTMRMAHEQGTDNEGYEQLVWPQEGGGLGIGDGLPLISFCPWCGKNVNATKEGGTDG